MNCKGLSLHIVGLTLGLLLLASCSAPQPTSTDTHTPNTPTATPMDTPESTDTPMPTATVTEVAFTSAPTAIPVDLTKLASGPIVFFSRENDLWRADLNGNSVERLTEGGILNWPLEGDEWWLASLYRPPQVSPDGHWITLSQTGQNLLLVDVIGQTQANLPGSGAPIVDWPPNSHYFAYVSPSRPMAGRDALYLYDIQGGRAEQLIDIEQGNGGGIKHVVWSPDNQFIAFSCCFTIPSDVYTGTVVGQTRYIEVATGYMETMGRIESYVAKSSYLCWTADGRLTTDRNQGVRCSYERWPYRMSSDGTQDAVLAPLSPGDVHWEGASQLIVSLRATGEVLWQREVSVASARIAAWSPDGQFLLIEDNDYSSPIWRIKADGRADFEEIMEKGFFLGVVPQWG